MMTLGRLLYRLRRAQQLTLEELAARAGMKPGSRGYLSKIERGEVVEPRRGTLRKLEAALNLPDHYLDRIPAEPVVLRRSGEHWSPLGLFARAIGRNSMSQSQLRLLAKAIGGERLSAEEWDLLTPLLEESDLD